MDSTSVYLDVDGVLCPFGPEGASDWGTDYDYADIGLLGVHYAPELVDALNALSRRPGVRFVWLTSWEDLAPKYLCRAIGLDGRHWPVLRSGGQGGIHDWWKLEAIQGDIERHRPARAVWIDDQLDFEEAAVAWMGFMGRGILGVSPDPRRGISRAGLGRITAFLDAGAGTAPPHPTGA
ncbi:HAD domain-containing protein [Arthrobacter sp. STN4]|uniref:HAD domain-containing protein n=1 Tax=Arthrobacter sp. STN4 TaxID=2923276 RepID=UPI00211A379E|nr:HAD domain-containing protein [Arthrobacter sp. STN4]MCQ9165514.1 HAD domain-containing protein [Arthrobacter sp. STN4]